MSILDKATSAGKANVSDYLATLTSLIPTQYFQESADSWRESADSARQRLDELTNYDTVNLPIVGDVPTSMGWEMLVDPANLVGAPAAKGAKFATRAIKGAATNAGINAGIAAGQLGGRTDLSAKEKLAGIAGSGALGGLFGVGLAIPRRGATTKAPSVGARSPDADANIADSILKNVNKLSEPVPTASVTTVNTGNISTGLPSGLISTAGGAAFGGFNDINNDGVIDVTDILLGAGLGAGGSFAARKGLPKVGNAIAKAGNAAGRKLSKSQAVQRLLDSNLYDYVTGSKIRKNAPYLEQREALTSSMPKLVNEANMLQKVLMELDAPVRSDLTRYMVGDPLKGNLPPEVKAVGDRYRKIIDDFGQELVNEGTFLTQADFDKWKGKYLHRTYENNVDAAKKFLRGGSRLLSENQARGKMWKGTQAEYERLLQEGKIGSAAEGLTEAKELSNGKYQFRRDYTPEERELMGEITDAAFTIPETLSRMNQLVQHSRFLKNVANLTGSVSDDAVAGWKQVSGSRWGALNGKYIAPEVYRDIRGLQESVLRSDSDLMNAYKQYLGLWKRSKTVFRPGSHVNNVMSNISIMLMDGLTPADLGRIIPKARKDYINYTKMLDLQAKDIAGTISPQDKIKLNVLLKDEGVMLAREAADSGVFGQTRLRDITPFEQVNRQQTGILSKAKQKAEDLYQYEDFIPRLAYKNYLQGAKGYHGKGGAKFKTMTPAEARKYVLDYFPDYTRPMSGLAMDARNIGLVPFISWTWYTLPAILRQLDIRKMTPNGKSRANQLLGLSLLAVAPLLSSDVELGEELPKGFKGFARTPILGTDMWLKTDRWLPHQELLSPIEKIRRDFLTGGLPASALGNLNNYDFYYGNKITYRDGAAGAYDRTKSAVQNLVPAPAFGYELYNLLESALLPQDKRQKNPYLTPRTSMQSLAANLGFNTANLDLDAWRTYREEQRLKEIKKRLKQENK